MLLFAGESAFSAMCRRLCQVWAERSDRMHPLQLGTLCKSLRNDLVRSMWACGSNREARLVGLVNRSKMHFAMGATFISARCSCLCGVLLRQAGNYQLLIRDSGAGQPARLWCHSASRHGFKFRPWRPWLSPQTIGCCQKHIGSIWVHVILIWIDIFRKNECEQIKNISKTASNIVYTSTHIVIQYTSYTNIQFHWLQISVQGRFWFDFCSFFRFVHFKIRMNISRKNWPLHVFIFQSCWVYPGISALFLGICAQKNRRIFAQSRVRSAQKVRYTKLTTVDKKWPFPGPSQEILPKGRNLANGQLCVSFPRSRCIIYIYIYIMYMYIYRHI